MNQRNNYPDSGCVATQPAPSVSLLDDVHGGVVYATDRAMGLEKRLEQIGFRLMGATLGDPPMLAQGRDDGKIRPAPSAVEKLQNANSTLLAVLERCHTQLQRLESL